VHERASQLKREGTWIPLRELLTYNEIGSKTPDPSRLRGGWLLRPLPDRHLWTGEVPCGLPGNEERPQPGDDDRNADTLRGSTGNRYRPWSRNGKAHSWPRRSRSKPRKRLHHVFHAFSLSLQRQGKTGIDRGVCGHLDRRTPRVTSISCRRTRERR